MVYDDTCRRANTLPFGLTHSWIAGNLLYRGLGRIDASFAAHDWDGALQWLASFGAGAIDEIQFWGHGKWGMALIDKDVLDVRALHTRRRDLDAVKERLHKDSMWWFRTCETLGGEAGHRFAAEWADHFGCSVAGHTYIIGPWQSGLHLHEPGTPIHWSAWEGVQEGSANNPTRAKWSAPREPNTISCLQSVVPAGW